ncbi:FYN-binding protein 1 isoform X1 [Phycodurus eques]|uniref:FYN-binding protein 1 isoform X1 n=1 Tax=Phycodurus eques TaxID=693459 RepID=UPI002ACE25FD|nr:FYN-binding protein 1 isoform X1 [Phycodurus eques]
MVRTLEGRQNAMAQLSFPQEDTMDFKALRARFQEEQLLLSQPRMKPTLPEKPKVVPPPHSPTQYLPAGARPSLLTSINWTLDNKTVMPPRVVFKDEKKESKKPLIRTTSTDKNEKNLRAGKDKMTKGSKVPFDEYSLFHKLKKDSDKDKKPPPVTTAELVSVPALPKVSNSKKKGFLGLKWSAKTNPDEVLADPILDAPTLDGPGLAPLIPIPPEFADVEPEPEILPPNILSLSDSDVAIPVSPGFTPPPSFIPDIPAPHLPSPESETPLEIKTATLPIYTNGGQGKMSLLQTSQSIYQTISIPPFEVPSPTLSSPEPKYGVPGSVAAISIAALLNPRPPSVLSSLPAEGSASALSALERAEDVSQGRRTTAADQRILNALQKARRKPNHNSQKNSSISSTPPPDDVHLPQSPNRLLADLPPIDLNSRARQLNSIDPGQALPALEDTYKEGTEDVLLDVFPPHPRNVLLDRASLGVPPKKPAKPSLIKIPNFIPPSPPMQHNAIPVPSELPEMNSTNEPPFGGMAPGAPSPELTVSQRVNGNCAGPDIPDGNKPPLLYNNGIMLTGPKGLPVFADNLRDQPPPHLADSPFSTSLEGQAMAGHQAHNSGGTGSYYENLYSAKGKAKTEVGKKRKGPPKNPYAEANQESNEENNKTGWFGKVDKKSAEVAEAPDGKELKKREKQRLEKERKELKEKQERDKKEQKEREKRANEMKKKYKITGYEEAMYHATVTVTTKGRKDDLPVQSGDNISIIRTTNCPKGKWLARDSGNNYGYVAVDHVELDIKEMLELGRKASGTRVSSPMDANITTTGIRTSNHYPQSTESFSDDSEEWTVDDDEALSSPTDAASVRHYRALSMPDMGNADLNITHQHRRSDISAGGPNVQANNEALQKLATFFHSPGVVQPPARRRAEPETRPVLGSGHAVHTHRPHSKGSEDPDLLILPPPDLYADDSE